MTDYETTYEEFWKPIIAPDGVLDLDLMKRELHDYRDLIHSASKVYCEVTGGMISKPNTLPEAVIAAADDYTQKQIQEAIDDEKKDAIAAQD